MSQQNGNPGTYVDRLLDTLTSHPDREAIVQREHRISYREAHSLILRMAAALTECGLRKGDAVAVYSGNHPEVLLLQLAVHLLGCQLVFVPPEPAVHEQLNYLRRAEPAAFVYSPAMPQGAELAEQARPRVVLSIGPGGAGDDLLALADKQTAALPAERAGRDDIATIFYTGGTTGQPKMVLHRHPYYDGLIFAGERRRTECPTPQRFLVCSTINHSSGHISGIVTLLAGGTSLMLPEFEPGEVIATMIREHATSVMIFPPMLYELLDHPDFPAGGFPSLIRLHYGAAPTAPARIREAIERFGPVLRQTYGLTEVPVVCTMEPEDHDVTVPGRLAACGKPLAPMVEVRLERDGEVVPTGEVGEVCVRGPLVMAEYRGDPEQTANAIKDGWLHTGDLGRFDADGFLSLVDRLKDVIVTGRTSFNVYSALLEAVLIRQPGVRTAAVVGLPDNRFGESVHAAIVPAPGVEVDEAALREQVVAELGETYEPRTITFVDALPWTSVGKVDKKAVRTMLAERLPAMEETAP
jgi:fatty-acyl-CoA synthase